MSVSYTHLNHGDAELFLDESDFLIINRIADAGDGMAVARLFGNQAAEQV